MRSDAPAGKFVQVSAVGDASCGVRTDGRVECWGYGTPGEPPAAAAPLVSASVGPRSSTHGRDDQSTPSN